MHRAAVAVAVMNLITMEDTNMYNMELEDKKSSAINALECLIRDIKTATVEDIKALQAISDNGHYMRYTLCALSRDYDNFMININEEPTISNVYNLYKVNGMLVHGYIAKETKE